MQVKWYRSHVNYYYLAFLSVEAIWCSDFVMNQGVSVVFMF